MPKYMNLHYILPTDIHNVPYWQFILVVRLCILCSKDFTSKLYQLNIHHRYSVSALQANSAADEPQSLSERC